MKDGKLRMFAVGLSTLLFNLLPNFVKLIKGKRKLRPLDQNFSSRGQLVQAIFNALRTCCEWNSTKRVLDEFYGISALEPTPNQSTLQTLRQNIC
ncbi:hypothetical protein PMAYCL1PPCAC_10732, partial [Pristionchus mayeri]